MNYKNTYDKLVSYRLVHPYNGYTEKHHILPKCMGGNDLVENIVKLSAREHYIAHLLLVKINPNIRGLINAAVLMGAQTGSTSRIYAKLREAHSANMARDQSGELNSQYGTKWVYSDILKVSKKIGIDDSVPEGFLIGRKLIFKEKPVSKKEQQKELNISIYTEYYKIYSAVGWDEFVIRTGYTKSKPNLVQMCKKYVKEFIPQNGKQRG